MLIIVDGMGRTGKTEFCNALVKELTRGGKFTKYVKFQRGEDGLPIVHHIRKSYFNMANDERITYVLDRGHGTEWVMSLYHGREVDYTHPQFMGLCRDLSMNHNIVMVHMTSPPELIGERARATGKPAEGDYATLNMLWTEFWLRAFKSPITIYNDDSATPENLAKVFTRLLEAHE